MLKYLIPNWIKEKITSWAVQLLNLETITPEQKEEIQELMKADSEKAFNRMLEIFQETTKRQQEAINQLTKENKELKEKLAKMESERQEISAELDEIEKMTEEHNRQKEQWEQEEKQECLIVDNNFNKNNYYERK